MNTDRVAVTEEDIDFAAGLYPALGPSVLISAARVRTWAEYVAEQYAARDKALREKIAGEMEAEAEQRLGGNSAPTVAQQDAADLLRYVARRIAQGAAGQ